MADKRKWAHLLVWTAALCGVSIAIASLPAIRSAVEIGGDEFFEVTKGLLLARGYSLYDPVWNDQPPLHTFLLAALFKVFGPRIVVARWLAIGFAFALLAGLLTTVRNRCGAVSAFVATVTLLVAPEFLTLGVSVMLELPAMAVSLWALCLIFRWQETRHWLWLFLAGLLAAGSLQIKLTAALMLPALSVEVLLGSKGTDRWSYVCDAMKNGIVWSGSILAGFLALGILLGGTYDLLWASQFSSRAGSILAQTNRHSFSCSVLLDHPEGLWGGIAGISLAAWRKEWRPLAFPVALLVTAGIIHPNHRPWWSYYYLHFAMPLAWLTGYAVAGFLAATRGGGPGQGTFFGPRASSLVASALISLLLFYGGTRFVNLSQRIGELPRVKDSQMIAKLKEFASKTRWVYTRGDIRPFHAGLIVIPELAVVPAKRIWSGRLTDEDVLTIVERYRPEQLVLDMSRPDMDAPLKAHFLGDYVMVCQEGASRLYVLKTNSDGKAKLVRDHQVIAQ